VLAATSKSSESEGRTMDTGTGVAPTYDLRPSTYLRVVHIDAGKELRGGQRQLLLLACGLRERGHEQLVVCPEDSLLEERARAEGLRVFALPAHDPVHAHGILLLRQRLWAEPFGILHAHDGKGQTIAWLASAGMPVRRVATRRVTFIPTGLAGGRLVHRLKYQFTCQVVIAISDFVRQILAESGVPADRIEVIPDGIKVPPELPNIELRSRMRAQWGFEDNDLLIGTMGSITPEKGPDIAIEALRVLERSLPRARLVVAGTFSGRELERRCGTQWARNRVRLVGSVDNLADFFAGLDLYAMPSRAEGLGSAALLAMAHGVPVVATRVGGLPEVVEDKRTGWLVPPESPTALAEAVVAAASDRARLRAFGLQARERARQFASDIMIERTETLYYRLLESRNRKVEARN
jgi:glycosyltransferase involved in cell wall biosynthesis